MKKEYSPNRKLFSQAFAEFIGAFAIVFFGCGAVSVSADLGVPGTVMIPLSFGGIVAVMVYTIGHLSGAHMNPAVTIAFAVVRHFPMRSLPMYIFMQCLGATAGAALLLFLIPDIQTVAPTVPTIPFWSAVIFEALLTFFVMFVVMAVATDTRAEGVMAGSAIGMVVALCAFIGGKYTGASMNPARSFGPALLENQLHHMPIYIIGPLLGSISAGLIYRHIKCHGQD